MAAYFRDRTSAVHHYGDFASIVEQESEFGICAFLSAQRYSLLASEGQRLFRAQGDEVSFEFGDESECEAEHFAVDGIVEGIMILGAVEMHLSFEQFADDGHDVRERAAQTRQLGYDERIARAPLICGRVLSCGR